MLLDLLYSYREQLSHSQSKPVDPPRICLAQGTKHQGDFFDGGKQCTCIALVFMCLKSTSAFQLSATTIDIVLQSGTDLYQSHIASHFNGENRYLQILELYVELKDAMYEIKLQEGMTGLIAIVNSRAPDFQCLTI